MLLYSLEAMIILQPVSKSTLIVISKWTILYIGGEDYDFTTHNVTIPSGKTHVSFDVSITNDNKLEDKEDFTLMIVSSSQSTVSVTNPNQTVVVIVDDDGKHIKI